MPCNCGGAKNKAYSYRYVAPGGKVTVYNTEVQARAAKITNKGGSYTKVPRR